MSIEILKPAAGRDRRQTPQMVIVRDRFRDVSTWRATAEADFAPQDGMPG